MEISQFESESAVWKKVEAALLARLAILRERNDGQLDADETAKIRGRIAEIKIMLDWPKSNPATEIPD